MARYLAHHRYESLSDFEKKFDRLFLFQPASSRGLIRCCEGEEEERKTLKIKNSGIIDGPTTGVLRQEFPIKRLLSSSLCRGAELPLSVTCRRGLSVLIGQRRAAERRPISSATRWRRSWSRRCVIWSMTIMYYLMWKNKSLRTWPYLHCTVKTWFCWFPDLFWWQSLILLGILSKNSRERFSLWWLWIIFTFIWAIYFQRLLK